MTFDDTPKEAKLHEGSVLLDASSGFQFLTLSSNANPNAAVATVARPSRAGNLYVPWAGFSRPNPPNG